MKYFYYISFLSLIICCKNSNSTVENSKINNKKNQCPLKEFEISEKVTTIDNGSTFTANLGILVDLSKKLNSKLDVGIGDTTFFDRIKDISSNKKLYSREYLEKHNPFIQAICAPYETWQDSTQSENIRQESYVLYKQMLKTYFDFLSENSTHQSEGINIKQESSPNSPINIGGNQTNH